MEWLIKRVEMLLWYKTPAEIFLMLKEQGEDDEVIFLALQAAKIIIKHTQE